MFTGLLLTIFTVVQLNCENMFDCVHDSLKDDAQFLPSALRHNTLHRYYDKLNKISKEITWCGCEGNDFRLPDIVTLCEVENDSVLTYLTRRSSLRNARYRYVMTDSPDRRGIDVALLYNPRTFCLLSHSSLRISPPEGMRPTRDVLCVKGVTDAGDTLDVLAVHMPSKYGGDKQTRPYRMLVADVICAAVDSLRRAGDRNIIVSGDFNDDAESEPLKRVEDSGLINISSSADGSCGAHASYKYRGRWQSIDHILVSPDVRKHLYKCVIKDAPFLLETDKKYGGKKPRRFWNGMRYNDGYSDHLPVVAGFKY